MAQTPRFRGENFKGKWSLGSWAEQKIINAINASENFRAVSYGKSGVSTAKTKEEVCDYWNLHKERESFGKRPDVLVFEKSIFDELINDEKKAELLKDLAGNLEADVEEIVNASLLGIESEASIWQGEKMKHFGRNWAEKTGGLKPLNEVKTWTAPTVIVKDEDLQPLIDWQNYYQKPIYIVHLFYDMALMLNFSKLRQYIAEGTVKGEIFDYGKASKTIYKTFYGLATEFGKFTELAEIIPFVSQTNGGKFEADLYFEGGEIIISQDTIQEWVSIKQQ
jgi:AccI restriction endonuclease